MFDICALLPACPQGTLMAMAGEHAQALRDLWQCHKASEAAVLQHLHQGCHMQILNAPKPDLSYFKDPNQDPAGDLLSGFETASVGKIQGPDFIDYSPCLVRYGPIHQMTKVCLCSKAFGSHYKERQLK